MLRARSNPMKIVHCVNQYMPLHMAGTEVYIHALAAMQKAAGHEVNVITPHIEHYRPGQRKEYYEYEGLGVYEYLEPADPYNRDIISAKKKPEGLANFQNLLTLLQPGIIHFHELNRSIGLGIEHVKLAKLSGAKVILTMHLSFYTCNTNTLIRNNKLCSGKIREYACSVCTYKTIFKLHSILAVPAAAASLVAQRTGFTALLPTGKITTLVSMPATINRIKKELMELATQVDRFVSISNWYKAILLDNGVPEKKITVIEQALATVTKNVFSPVSRPVALPLKMVFIGRIQPQKGIHLLIEALSHFTPGQVCVDIYGKPEDTVYYKKCIHDSLGMASIRWKGLIAREEVVETLSRYDLMCLPSTFSEMSPLVIQEAFAAGIPVLASGVYGNAEQVSDGYNGWLFTFNDSGDLKKKIQQLVDEPGKILMAKKNGKPVKTFAAVAGEYEKLYKEVTGSI